MAPRRSATRTRFSRAAETCCAIARPTCSTELFAAGATEIPFTATLPPTLTDRDPRPGDEELVGLACRRTTFEWVLRRVVLAEPGVELRDGVAVDGLDAVPGSPPLVTGVAGIAADLVVDARGPRSTSDPWLAAIGAAAVPEELHESGIVYFSRFYRVQPDADAPPVAGTVAADLGYLKFAVFVGDNETFSITYAVDTHDDELRKALARRGTVRSRRAGARADRTLAGARRRGADHGCARDGGVAQPVPALRRRRRAVGARVPARG